DKFHFDRRGFGCQSSPTIERPIFVCSSSQSSFRYLYEYILDGHARANLPLSPLQHEAVEAIQDLLGRNDIVLKVTVTPGELLIVKNARVCHGRTSFKDSVSQGAVRHLIRVWASQ